MTNTANQPKMEEIVVVIEALVANYREVVELNEYFEKGYRVKQLSSCPSTRQVDANRNTDIERIGQSAVVITVVFERVKPQ